MSLVIVGDEAYTVEEWEAEQRRRAARGYRDRRDYHRRWRASRLQAKVYHAVSSLHDLRCTGPTKKTGCRCKKTVLWEPEEAA